jgi:hypothetical protein
MESLIPGGSGIGPERALEAITLTPRAQRESPCSRELPCERRTDPAEPHPRLSPIARPATQPPPKNLQPLSKRKPKRPIPKDRQIATHHARTGGSGIGPERA